MRSERGPQCSRLYFSICGLRVSDAAGTRLTPEVRLQNCVIEVRELVEVGSLGCARTGLSRRAIPRLPAQAACQLLSPGVQLARGNAVFAHDIARPDPGFQALRHDLPLPLNRPLPPHATGNHLERPAKSALKSTHRTILNLSVRHIG